ncbi:Membrane-associated serine protease [Lacticaseibacillus brantae DSM 23927]|uniref:Membrane-associated serine protease n=2 Tax=Lacticaseibacillus brantae TaxID=943673 RepID=A0A0R2B8X0_9LACO|nr:Membrane-associated serine protease [Lacticaseibacillus brantae DSM 23927]
MPYVTYGLLAVTIIVFILEVLAGGSQDSLVLLNFGARYNLSILQGQWWRFITPMFLHIGLMHLVVNAVSLYYLGLMTESIFGHWRFLVIYLASGIAGNIASFVFNPNSLSAGASTAIFGLLGAFLLLGDVFRDNVAVRQLSRQYLLLVGLNLVFNLFSPGIDISGHIGGLVGGFLVAGAVGAPNLGEISVSRRWLTGGLFVLAAAALLVLGYRG